MICGYCRAIRAEDGSPCPACGGPSPVHGMSQAGGNEVGGWQPTTASWNQPAGDAQGGMPSWGGPMSYDGQAQQAAQFSFGQVAQSAPQEVQRQAMLPVPYQGGASLQPFYPQGVPMQMIPAQDISHLLPALPEEEAVYIPPMYTKPRPIVPRYRAISGLISFLIVVMVLCGGVVYYAKASGKLDAIGSFISGNTNKPANLQASQVNIPDPKNVIDHGPAYMIIPSATTTLNVDHYVPRETDVIFKPGQTFYLTYSVHQPPGPGKVHIKWYSNGQFYREMFSEPITITAKQDINGDTSMSYTLPSSGSVEIYWNNDLALRLYFAVRN